MHKFVFWLACLSLCSGPARAAERFEIHEGDRIALVGDTLIEREQESGWLEAEMAADFSDRRFIARNLGWSADTPAGASRASFDFADTKKAFDLLTGEIAQVKPTAVVLGYGMASSFAGQAGLAQFKTEVNRLIDTVQSQSSNQVRFVILSPIRHQEMPTPLPNPAVHNAQLSLYTEALREIARQRGFAFVDLFDWKTSHHGRELTDDGIHLTPEGYHEMAAEIGRQLDWPSHLKHANNNLVVALRQEIIRKNQLFFDRWRPQNETYLFGFRKYEQGKNAGEIPQFDPFVNAVDESIAQIQQQMRRGDRSAPPAPAPKSVAYKYTPQPLPEFTIAPGFEVNLWAENPLLAKPIQMNFDPQGRLWVASSSVYPQIEPGQSANDKIVVLEDTKNLGRADKSTVFVDGLFIPQGVEPGDGGCYVGQSTELLHFDGKVGSHKRPAKRVVLSGFGTEDTHHMVHTLKWGPDGMLYFDQSIYIHSHIETPNGVVRLNSGGIFHLRPPTMQLDVFLRGFCNPWGHQFDPFGQSFVTDGAGSQGINWGIRDATYFTYAIMRRELQSISPGSYPKFCGLEMVQSQQFPDDWQGNFITSDFRAHRVVRFSVSDDGSGYVTKEMPDVLTSTNVTFRPIDAKFGPDGALYIADWSNPIINHGEVDFRDPRRDHEHGRIWRITAKNRPLLPKQDLTKLRNGKLFDELLSPNRYEVEQARRVLTERGKNILDDLKNWIARHDDQSALLQALWMYQAVDVRNQELLDRVLRASDGRIRAAAIRVLSFWRATDKFDERLARALSDPFPRARVEALRAVATVPSLRSAELALDTLNLPKDPFLDYALWLTVNDLAHPLMDGLKSGQYKIEGHEKQLAFALNAIEPELAGPALDSILKRHSLARDGSGPWLELIGKAGSSDAVNGLYEKVLADGFNEAGMSAALAALKAAAARGVKPKSGLEKIVKYFHLPEAIRLAGDWGGPGDSFSHLATLAGAPKTKEPVRSAAFAALKKIGGERSIHALEPLTMKSEPAKIRREAILTLAALDAAHSGSNAVSLLSGITNSDDALAVWRELLGNSGGGAVLAAALPRNGFPNVVGKAGMRAVRETGRNEPELVVALTRAAGLQGKETVLTAAEIKKLGQQVSEHGDAGRGEHIFRSAQQSCVNCHSIGGVGGKVGPDLTSIGASSPIDYLIESVLYPNKQIKDGFQSYSITTTDGEDVSGIPVRENDHELVVRNATDQEISISKNKIKSKKVAGSLMPAGLVDNLSTAQQLDLYRFLSELGKPGPFDASKGNVARLWTVAADPVQSADEQKMIDSTGAGEPWHRAMSLVSGRLLVEDLKLNGPALVAARFRNVKAGPVQFVLSGQSNASAWIDGKPVQHDKIISANLAAGAHTIILKLDGKASITLQSDDVTFLTSAN